MEICLKGWRETLYRLDPLKKTEKKKKKNQKLSMAGNCVYLERV